MKRYLRNLLVITWVALAASPIHADDDTTENQSQTKTAYKLEDITVQDKLSRESLSATGASILSADDVQGRIYQQAMDVVELTPGVVVPQNYRAGVTPGFTMRGFTSLGHGSPDATFFIDRIPLNFRYIMNTNMIIPLELQRVDVLKGPVSALYGNYHSAGAVHYHTIQDDNLSRMQLRYGSYNTSDASGVVARDDGTLSQTYAAQLYHSDGMRDNSRYDRQNAAARWKYKISEALDAGLAVRVHNSDWDGPCYSLPDFLYEKDRFATTTTVPEGSWGFYSTEAFMGWNISTQSRLELSGYGLQHDMMNVHQGYWSPESTSLYAGGVDEVVNDTIGANLIYTFDGDWFTRPAKLTLGMNYQHENEDRDSWEAYKDRSDPKGPRKADWDFTFDTLAFFGQMDYRVLEPLRLIVGLRWDEFDGEADVQQYSDDSYLGHHETSDDLNNFSPKVGLVFYPFAQWELFTNYAEGFSLPTSINLFAADDVSPALRKQWEGGLRGHPVDWLDFSVTGYLMNTTDDLENVAESGAPPNYVNAGKTRRKGVELEANLYPATNWRLHFNYSYIDARYIETDVVDDKQYNDNKITKVPEHVANAELSFSPAEGLGGRAWLRYVGESWADKSNEHKIDDYAVVDFQLNYRFSPKYMLALDVANLFDTEYESAASWSSSNDYWTYVPGAPLGFYLTLTIDW